MSKGLKTLADNSYICSLDELWDHRFRVNFDADVHIAQVTDQSSDDLEGIVLYQCYCHELFCHTSLSLITRIILGTRLCSSRCLASEIEDPVTIMSEIKLDNLGPMSWAKDSIALRISYADDLSHKLTFSISCIRCVGYVFNRLSKGRAGISCFLPTQTYSKTLKSVLNGVSLKSNWNRIQSSANVMYRHITVYDRILMMEKP